MMMGMETAPPATAATASGASTKAKGSQFTSAISQLPQPAAPARDTPLLALRARELLMTTAARQPMRQVTRQHDAQLRIGTHLHVIDVLHQTTALQFADEVANLFKITVAQRTRIGQQFGILLQPAKQRGLLKGKLQFRPIQDVHDNDFMSL